MEELEQFVSGIPDDVESVEATPSYRPASESEIDAEKHGFEIIPLRPG